MKNWKPKVIFSDKFLDAISWFFSVGGISIFPIVIMRENYLKDNEWWQGRKKKTINHETIHFQQQLEMLVLPFYVLYILEYALKFIYYRDIKKAYMNISFEREAYKHEWEFDYLNNRKRYNWIKLIF